MCSNLGVAYTVIRPNHWKKFFQWYMNSIKSVSVVFGLKEMSLIILHSVFQEKSRLVFN